MSDRHNAARRKHSPTEADEGAEMIPNDVEFRRQFARDRIQELRRDYQRVTATAAGVPAAQPDGVPAAQRLRTRCVALLHRRRRHPAAELIG
jgi:hypothetical protein